MNFESFKSEMKRPRTAWKLWAKSTVRHELNQCRQVYSQYNLQQWFKHWKLYQMMFYLLYLLYLFTLIDKICGFNFMRFLCEKMFVWIKKTATCLHCLFSKHKSNETFCFNVEGLNSLSCLLFLMVTVRLRTV